MQESHRIPPERSPKRFTGTLGASLLLLAVLAIFGRLGMAQQLTGTLSGTVFDQAGAVVPNAKVVLKNDDSGDLRDTVSDKQGFFSITSVQPASYTITVSAKGFAAWQEGGIAMGQGDTRSVANIKLRVSGKSDEVEVISGQDAVVPVDTAEISTTLNTEMIEDLPIGGRDAGELMKIMPGFALNNGLGQGSSFNPKVVGSNNGPVGAYSSNGTQPNGTMAFMLDGADLVDPGNFGTQIANINQDMVSQIKVLTSSYTAEYAKGPVLFEAFSKSGGSRFHGEGYLYARNSALNSWDAFTKNVYDNTTYTSAAAQATTAAEDHPNEHYYYIGGNVGGPVLIPFTHFNKDHNKLFFWGGYEYMLQQPAATPVLYNVPTVAQLSGDFTNPGVPAGVLSSSYSYAYDTPNGNLPANATKTSIPTSDFDPDLQGLLAAGAYPKPNITPTLNNSWNNYEYVNATPVNRWEATGKLDYSFSESTKVTASYSRQDETDQHPLAVWWAAPWTLPYPSEVVAPTVGHFIMSNFTHVFNPTTTNEFVFTYARWINPSSLSQPDKVDRKALGFNVPTIFNHGHYVSQIPNIEGPWGGALPNLSEESFDKGFDGSAFGGTKLSYGTYDNFTKVIGTHTVKVGAYWDFAGDNQTSSNPENGTYNLGWGNNDTGNLVSDFLLGRTGNYNEQSTIPIYQIGFHQWSLYAQDAWKVSRKLTLNLGVRADHEGQWYGGQINGGFWWGGGGTHDLGFQVWDPSKYVNVLPSAAPANTGIEWNAKNSSVPLSGFGSTFLQFSPRVGAAYDVFGTGRTVVRGGFAMFQYQVTSQVGSAWNGPQNSYGYTAYNIGGPLKSDGTDNGYGGVASVTPPSGNSQNGSSIYVMQKGDNRNPYTSDWNFTISQALKWRSVFEVSYVGNHSGNLYQDGSNGGIGNLNNVPYNAQYGVDMYPGSVNYGLYTSPTHPICSSLSSDPTGAQESTYCAQHPAYANTYTQQDYAPLLGYQNVYLLSHTGHSNYNSMQVSWQKQSGPVTFLTNYTFSKVLGTLDYVSSNGAGAGPNPDTFNLKNDYGPLAYDHTHVLNLSYIWNMPKFVHGNKILGGAVNGWQLSGYTALQSGAALQPGLNSNLNTTWPGGLSTPTLAYPDLPDLSYQLPNGLRSIGVNQATWFGTGSQRVLLPKLTCNPRANLAKGYYFNPACFGPPDYQHQGTIEWPYMRGPAYFNSDLALFKNFQIKDSQKLQFRVQATNFLNHPLRQFGLGGNGDESLNFSGTANSQYVDGGKPVTYNFLSPTNLNTETTGKPIAVVGNRNFLLSAKYYF